MADTDFQKIINDLRASGLSLQAIANQAGVTKAYISMLSKGDRVSPNYDVGRRIVALWELVR